MHHDGADARLGSEAVPNQGALQAQFSHGAAVRLRLRPTRHEGSIRDANGWQAAGCTQVDGQSGATRMVQSGCVDHEDVGGLPQLLHRLLEQRTFSQGEEAWRIGCVEYALDDRGLDALSINENRGGGPGWLARHRLLLHRCCGCDKHPGHANWSVRWRPPRWLMLAHLSQAALKLFEVSLIVWPGCHVEHGAGL